MAAASASPQSDGAMASLLSLSIAAESASPIDNGVPASKQHRRPAPTSRGRKHDRDATNGASPAALQPSSAGLSLASLSLSTSPPGQAPSSGTLSNTMVESKPKGTTPIAIGNGRNGKKRGFDYKCETCSKIYRHPSCLIKHRWEHTSHWREASKFVLSKHQQVQLLEAAAILSHLSPESVTGTSLPEDRSLWPSFLSNGSLPPPEGATFPPPAPPRKPMASSAPDSAILSSSAPNSERAGSTGPRMHDYSISGGDVSGITQLRPGLLGVPTGSSPVPVLETSGYRDSTSGGVPASWGSSFAGADSYEPNSLSAGGSWSLPRSSLRSDSESRSGSRSDDEESVVDIEVDENDAYQASYADHYSENGHRVWKREEEDGMNVVYDFGARARGGDDEQQLYDEKVRGRGRNIPAPLTDEWDGMEMDMDME